MPKDRLNKGSLRKMDAMIILLDHESKWCKGERISSTGQRCIMGAMDTVGAGEAFYDPIDLAIKQVTGKQYTAPWRFNDDPDTTYLNVITVLGQAKRNIEITIAQRGLFYRVANIWQRVFH